MQRKAPDLGVLAVGDRGRHPAADRDLATLEDVAALVAHEMEPRPAVRRAVRLDRVG